ncbi:hypothetical protein NLT11_000756 [Cronobacter sakazakii]|uniref:hypothetical protein n=1 Tax=Cronobacter sakazakii TaxID=28141 RepID=UPI0012BBCB7F|nr:hypothetical protein [Cronobacter sakazakii]EIX1851621.1 hypothetical protein [Cronobacter sakazakii]EIZ0674461.1 hypothetical protein [Cronobacter sakazakii]EIZ2444886.1 hypothetical protein [Cronobacter sakazakii]EIZ2451276.1 hypothetical protein [Cronobacter sakazakii]EIZ2460804.1 hypothetical protein [Cronobacter sakazakii]
MPNLQRTPIASQVEQLQTVAVNARQQAMIIDLKHMGLLNKPNFSLAYGPTTSSTNNQ